MADDKDKGATPEVKKGPDAKAAAPTPKIADAITNKYKLHPSIQPCRMHFTSWGNTEIDMRTATVEQIDAFVAKYADQKYFLPK